MVFSLAKKVFELKEALIPPSFLAFLECFCQSSPSCVPDKDELLFRSRVSAFSLQLLQEPDCSNILLILLDLSTYSYLVFYIYSIVSPIISVPVSQLS